MKKVCFIVALLALITCLTGIPNLVQGISARGWAGVNYGPVLFPFLISGISFWLFKR